MSVLDITNLGLATKFISMCYQVDVHVLCARASAVFNQKVSSILYHHNRYT